MRSTPNPSESVQRSLWRRVEAIHAVTYFGGETRDAAIRAGLSGFWMGYFGFRAAPLGSASAVDVQRTFFNFAPTFVERWVPEVWDRAAPTQLLATRAKAAAATLRRLSGRAESTMIATEAQLSRLDDETVAVQRPLYSANRAAPLPDDPAERLWQYTTMMREHRGDGHVAALIDAELDGCEALALISAEQGIPAERFRQSRGWTDDEWDAAEQRLLGRGLLSARGVISDRGSDLRADIEATTDRLAGSLTAALSGDEVAGLTETLDRLASDITSSDLIPFPNPVGLPDPRR